MRRSIWIPLVVVLLQPSCSEETPSPGIDSQATDGPVTDAPAAELGPAPDGSPDTDGPSPGDGQPGPDTGTSPKSYEGFGAKTKGAASSPAGSTDFHVTSLADSGKGTLRDGLSAGGRRIVFDVAGTITLASTLEVRYPYVTIDGATAPKPGITIVQPSGASTVRFSTRRRSN